LQNLGYSGTNLPVGSTISAAFISPAGIAGYTGATGPTGPQGATGPANTNTGSTGANRVTSLFFNSTTGPTGPANLSFPVKPNTNQAFYAIIQTLPSGTPTAMAYGMLLPSGAQMHTVFHGYGLNPSVSQDYQISIPTAGGPTGGGFWNINGLSVDGIVIAPTGVTGTAQVVFYPLITGNTGGVGTGSFMVVFPSN
jgi:hypothetical protein